MNACGITAPSPRSLPAREKLMRSAERLYAVEGFANVSVRKISEAAGQRNKSAVQYHFSGRDELIKAILAEHANAIEKYRTAMTASLGPPSEMSPGERMDFFVLPHVEHHIELGTPSWYGRFLAQVTVEPTLRQYAVEAHLNTPSLGSLHAYTQREHRDHDPELYAQHGVMVRQLIVHMCAEIETDLAHGEIGDAEAERCWRRLGKNLTVAVHGLTTSLLGDRRHAW